jgi:hypothetical protein
MKTNVNFWSYLAKFFQEYEMFQTKHCIENKNTHFVFLCVRVFVLKIVPWMR